MKMELNEAMNKLQQAGCLVEKMTEEEKAAARKERALLRAVKQADTVDKFVSAVQALKAEYGENMGVQFNIDVYPTLWLSRDKDGKNQWTLYFDRKEPDWRGPSNGWQ